MLARTHRTGLRADWGDRQAAANDDGWPSVLDMILSAIPPGTRTLCQPSRKPIPYSYFSSSVFPGSLPKTGGCGREMDEQELEELLENPSMQAYLPGPEHVLIVQEV